MTSDNRTYRKLAPSVRLSGPMGVPIGPEPTCQKGRKIARIFATITDSFRTTPLIENRFFNSEPVRRRARSTQAGASNFVSVV